MILYMYIAQGPGQITSDDKISELIYSFCYYDHFLRSFIMIHQIVKESEAKNHLLYIDKCYNFAINYGNLPISNPKRYIVDTNAYAKFK